MGWMDVGPASVASEREPTGRAAGGPGAVRRKGHALLLEEGRGREGLPALHPNLLSTLPGTRLPAWGPGELPGACPAPRPSPGQSGYRPAGRLPHNLGGAPRTAARTTTEVPEVPVQAAARIPSSSRSPGSLHRTSSPRPPERGQMEAHGPVSTAWAGARPPGSSCLSLSSFDSTPAPSVPAALAGGWVAGEGHGANRTRWVRMEVGPLQWGPRPGNGATRCCTGVSRAPSAAGRHPGSAHRTPLAAVTPEPVSGHAVCPGAQSP